MFERELTAELLKAVQYYPVVTLTGPRQSGKTTLVKNAFPEYSYFNLEDPDTIEQIENDPKGFLQTKPRKVILDEIQNYPKLLSYIQVVVDEQPDEKGQFILTGSHQFTLMESINQSLAGRTDILVLYPMSLHESLEIMPEQTVDEWMFNGFYPRIYKDHIPGARASKNYIKTYVERDVRKIINIRDVRSFQKFIKILAGRIGQIVNIQSICNELGTAYQTLNSWLNLLEASHLIYLLHPYYENFGKRLIKSPKIYFVDTGLICYLLGIKSLSHLESHPLRGNIFENMVVMEFVKSALNRAEEPDIYFFRDNNGNEVDIILEKEGELIPVEIKSSQTFNNAFTKGVRYFQRLTTKAGKGYVIYTGLPIGEGGKTSIINYKQISKFFYGLHE